MDNDADDSGRLGLRAGFDELEAEIGQLSEDRDRYEDALRTMAGRSRRPMRHISQTIIYMIGDTATDDVVTESYRTTAQSEKEPLLWHHVNLGLMP